eukprot:Tbor_TRINITY_DN5122_c0_g2::TRINITY_DN5122_c0_g2_i1::g.25779::m.25779
MVSFQCSKCGDVVKKPKVLSHAQQCGTRGYSCVDCMESFDISSVTKHNSCLTEVERYQGKWRQTTNAHYKKQAVDSSEDEGNDVPKKNKTVLQRPKRPPLSFTDSDDDEKPITNKNNKNGVNKTPVIKAAKKTLSISPKAQPNISPTSTGKKKRSKRSRSLLSCPPLPPSTVEIDRRAKENAAREADNTALFVEISLGNSELVRGLVDEIVQDLSSKGGVTRASIAQEFVMRYTKRINKAFTKTLNSFIIERGY